MARKSKSGVNKSQAIRDYIAANPKSKPKEIVEALKGQGVEVTPAFVSTLRSNDKRKSGAPRGRRGRRPAEAVNGSGLGIESLVQAKKLVDKMGGVGEARRALEALARILAE